jgi:hypothetical protein
MLRVVLDDTLAPKKGPRVFGPGTHMTPFVRRSVTRSSALAIAGWSWRCCYASISGQTGDLLDLLREFQGAKRRGARASLLLVVAARRSSSRRPSSWWCASSGWMVSW